MVFIIFVSITLGVTLSINASDDLGSSHCFKRISSGERLIAYEVTRIVEKNDVEGCQDQCNIYKCTFFGFGFPAQGNGTCELTTDREISRRQDPNFDLYQRTEECAEGKPKGYEKTCYRRIISGKRLHERFIRHSLPCNSLEACQHQCSIEKHFDCQGFNIRLDPANIGRGICELSSVATTYLDLTRDFVFDPEFVYYERDYGNGSPNCGHINQIPNVIPPDNNGIGYNPPGSGGPYYGGDSYGPWSTGHGTVDHGPWGSHGYGSGFYESNNPSRGPVPSFQPNPPQHLDPLDPYSYANRGPNPGYLPPGSNYPGGKGGPGSSWNYPPPPPPPTGKYPFHDKGYDRPSKPTYIIIDADANRGGYGHPQDLQPYRPPSGGRPYLPPPRQQPPQPPRPLPPPPRPQYPPPQPQYPSSGLPPQPQYPSSGLPPQPHNPPHGLPPQPQYPSSGLPPQPHHPSPGLPSQPHHPPPGLPPQPYHPPPGPSPQPHHPPPGSPSQPQHPPHGLLPQPQPPRPVPPSSPHGSGFFDRPNYSPGPSFGGSPNAISHEVCFRREHPGYKLNPSTIRGTYEVPTVMDCEAMCTKSPFKCTGYSYRYSSSGGGAPNCLLTDYTALNRDTHLLPDRSCDVYFKMGTCSDTDRMSDTECFLRVASNREIDSSKIVQKVSVTGMSECELACLNAKFFTCRSFTFRHGPTVIGQPYENCYLSDWPVSALSHLDFVPLPNHEVFERGSYGHGCELDAGPPHIGPRPPFMPYPNVPQIAQGKDPWGVGDTWRHFTVNGWPCRIGTECQLNPEAGFWSCEVEGGDKAQWDYCCRPKHSCGFSKGYNYPWCYVGEARSDQWRPCSEFYYPEFGNRYQYKPVQSNNPHPVDSYGPPRHTRPWKFGDEYGPPSHWPIAYVYDEPPPNETYVWDPEEHFHHYYDYHLEQLQHEHDHDPNCSPQIKFKPCGHKITYPRAIIQKLDLKDRPKVGSPGEQLREDEKPRLPKKLELLHKDPDTEIMLGFSSSTERGASKNEMDFFPSVAPYGNFTSGKRGLQTELNVTESSTNKTKEIIKTVEKLIEESSGSSGKESEKDESLKKLESKHSGFVTLAELERYSFHDGID